MSLVPPRRCRAAGRPAIPTHLSLSSWSGSSALAVDDILRGVMSVAERAEVRPIPAVAAGRQRHNVVDLGREQSAAVVFADRVRAQFGRAQLAPSLRAARVAAAFEGRPAWACCACGYDCAASCADTWRCVGHRSAFALSCRSGG